MYQNNKIVCLIPARGGSKGLPGKNIKNLEGKPLIAYSIEQARESKYIDRVIVSTEDSQIAEIAKLYGAEIPFMRPTEFSADNSGAIDVLLHAIDWLESQENYSPDILLLLHVTAPLRAVEDIDNCIELLLQTKADNVFSVTESHRNPYFNMVELNHDGKVSLVKNGDYVTRQSAPKVFDMNSSIYIWRVDMLKAQKKTILDNSSIYVMPKERSVDIDDLIDFKLAELLMRERKI